MASEFPPPERKSKRDESDDPRPSRQPPVVLRAQDYVWPEDAANVGSPYWSALLSMTIERFHEEFSALGLSGFGSRSVIYVNAKELRLALARRAGGGDTKSKKR